jgi:hypothetical protein
VQLTRLTVQLTSQRAAQGPHRSDNAHSVQDEGKQPTSLSLPHVPLSCLKLSLSNLQSQEPGLACGKRHHDMQHTCHRSRAILRNTKTVRHFTTALHDSTCVCLSHVCVLLLSPSSLSLFLLGRRSRAAKRSKNPRRTSTQHAAAIIVLAGTARCE